MKKESNGILKLILTLAGALITIGVLCATIRSNEQRLNNVEIMAFENEKDIRELKTDVKYIRAGIDEIKKEVKK